ncbi:MAG: hypothetical protein ACJASV_002624 [Pseudorhodobacter sp.]|jgi:hypothetical protein
MSVVAGIRGTSIARQAEGFVTAPRLILPRSRADALSATILRNYTRGHGQSGPGQAHYRFHPMIGVAFGTAQTAFLGL